MVNHPNRNRSWKERAIAALPRAQAEFDAQHTPAGDGTYFSTGQDAERTADALLIVRTLAQGEAARTTMHYATDEQISRLLTRLAP